MSEMSMDVINIIMMYIVEHNRISDRMSIDIKKKIAYDYEFNILINSDRISYLNKDKKRISISEYVRYMNLSDIHIYIALKRIVMIELISKKHLKLPGWGISIMNLENPFLILWNENYNIKFQEFMNTGLVGYYIDNMISIGGIKFKLKWFV